MKELTDKQLVGRVIRATRRGQTPRAYCLSRGWDYQAVYYRLTKAGYWKDVMAAKYAQSTEAAR